MNKAQLMWLDVITAVLQQPTFEMSIGGMSYVFRNIIAKFVSSSEFYKVSKGTEKIILGDADLLQQVENKAPIDMKKHFYGRDKQTLLEHMVPTSIIAKLLIDLGPQPSRAQVEKILAGAGDVVIILRTENKLLSKSKMPERWTISDSPVCRYDDAGVYISDLLVRRNKNIYR